MTKDERTDELVKKAQAELSKQVVRLQDELDAMIKMTSHQRQSLEVEMLRDYEGHKKEHADPKVLLKLNSLSRTADLLVSARIRLDKHLKALADTMTAEEEKVAVETYIKSLPRKEGVDMCLKLLEWHRKKAEAEHGLTGPTS